MTPLTRTNRHFFKENAGRAGNDTSACPDHHRLVPPPLIPSLVIDSFSITEEWVRGRTSSQLLCSLTCIFSGIALLLLTRKSNGNYVLVAHAHNDRITDNTRRILERRGRCSRYYVKPLDPA